MKTFYSRREPSIGPVFLAADFCILSLFVGRLEQVSAVLMAAASLGTMGVSIFGSLF